jgi:hypothetical protein
MAISQLANPTRHTQPHTNTLAQRSTLNLSGQSRRYGGLTLVMFANLGVTVLVPSSPTRGLMHDLITCTQNTRPHAGLMHGIS